MKLTDQIISMAQGLLHFDQTQIYDRDMWNMDRIGRSLDTMERDLAQLSNQEREINLQYSAIKAHLDALRRQKEDLEQRIWLAKQGQLDLDVRTHPDVDT